MKDLLDLQKKLVSLYEEHKSNLYIAETITGTIETHCMGDYAADACDAVSSLIGALEKYEGAL